VARRQIGLTRMCGRCAHRRPDSRRGAEQESACSQAKRARTKASEGPIRSQLVRKDKVPAPERAAPPVHPHRGAGHLRPYQVAVQTNGARHHNGSLLPLRVAAPLRSIPLDLIFAPQLCLRRVRRSSKVDPGGVKHIPSPSDAKRQSLAHNESLDSLPSRRTPVTRMDDGGIASRGPWALAENF
jgi:hypothetical protein